MENLLDWIEQRYFWIIVGLSFTNISACTMIPNVGAGPVIGLTTRPSLVLGWEAGGGIYQTVRANIGGSYRLQRSIQRSSESMPSELDSKKQHMSPSNTIVHYLAYEPGLIGGGTLGVSYGNQEGFDRMY